MQESLRRPDCVVFRCRITTESSHPYTYLSFPLNRKIKVINALSVVAGIKTLCSVGNCGDKGKANWCLVSDADSGD